MKNVVIVGAGLGGLSSGVRLSREGYHVTIIEKHIIPGGYATNFKRKAKTGENFNFDVALHGIGDLNEGRIINTYFKELGIFDRVKFLRKPETATVLFDDEYIDIPDSFDEYKKLFLKKFPDERDGLERLFKYLEEVDEGMKVSYEKGITPRHTDELQNITLYDFLKRFVQSDKVIDLFSLIWLYCGLPPKEINANYYLDVWFSYHMGGTYYIEGGSASLSQTMADIIKENGGNVVLKEEVVKVNTNGDKIVSVETDKGKVFKGDIFIINACPENILECVDDKAKVKDYLQEVKQLETSCSLTQLYIGLDCNPISIGLDKADLFFGYNETSSEGYHHIKAREYEKAHFCLTNYNVMDPSLNKDTGVLVITCGDLEEHWAERGTEEYKRQKEEVTQILLQKVYDYFPQMKEHVVLTELGTPRTMKRYTNNKYGAVYGFAQNLHNGGFNRMGQRMFFDNTFLAGAWTRPGGGYEGAILSGIFCSDIILTKYQEEVVELEEDDILEPDMFMIGMLSEVNKDFVSNITANYMFNFKDINKKYFLKVDNGRVTLENNLNNIDTEIICDYNIWYKIANNQLSGEVAFKGGDLKTKGSAEKFEYIEKMFAPSTSQFKNAKQEKKLVKGDLLIPLSLVPFIVYWAASSFYDNSILFLMVGVLYPIFIMPLFKPNHSRREMTLIEKSSIVTFSLYSALGILGNGVNVYSELILPILMIISCFLGESAIAQYTKLGFKDSVLKTKLFSKINVNLTIVWAIIFVVQFIVVKVLFPQYPIASLTYLLSIVGLIISIVYPNKAMGK